MESQNVSTSPQTNKMLVLGALEKAIGGDIDAFVATLAPDIQVHEPDYLPYGGTYHGPDGFLELLGEATKILDLGSMKVLTASADEDRVILLMRADLVGTGDPMLVTEHWTISGDRITDVRVFWFGLPPN
jgi:ketosteroid isomerase-like protein